MVPSPLCSDSSSAFISHAGHSPCVFTHGRSANPPLSAPCTSMAFPSSSSSPLRHCATNVFQFDSYSSSAPFETTSDRQTPPPLPPKPNHLSEQQSEEVPHRLTAWHFPSHAVLFPRRTSFSSLDHFKIGILSSQHTQ